MTLNLDCALKNEGNRRSQVWGWTRYNVAIAKAPVLSIAVASQAGCCTACVITHVTARHTQQYAVLKEPPGYFPVCQVFAICYKDHAL